MTSASPNSASEAHGANVDDTIEIVLRVRRSDVAALFAAGLAAPAPSVAYVTGGKSPILPPGYSCARKLEDACRSGELRGTPVPRSGWRITAEDLAAWEASRSRRRRRDPKPANDAAPAPSDAAPEARPDGPSDGEILAQVGAAPRRRASGGRR